jgi:beta-catenin-like protein 1
METFIPSKRFAGARPGYVFKNGDQGVGYYPDIVQQRQAALARADAAYEREISDRSISEPPGKRSRVDVADTEARIEVNEESGAVDAAAASVELITEDTLQQVLLSFEKKVSKNQLMRAKFPDQPEKFLDSEVDLHQEVLSLYALAASPELYPLVVKLSAVSTILGMVAHENTDISLAAVGLIQEMTDPETFVGNEEDVGVFVNAFIKEQGLELLVQNLNRLDESKNEEDAQGVYNTLGVIENLIEVDPDFAKTVCEKTQLLSFLLTRLKSKNFDANKFYCAEILSMLLQSDSSNTKRLCNSPGLNGLDSLLEILFQYRKRDPESVEEEECVQDLFLSLCTVLMVPSNQEAFRSAEGFDFLVRFLKERRFAAAPAVKAINFAISGSMRNCEAFVDAGGLKYIFPLFMGRNMPKLEKKKEKQIGKVTLGFCSSAFS